MSRKRGMISVGQALFLGPLPMAILLLTQDWYVDVNAPGCPAGTGTQADPFCDIMDAVTAASDGDTLHIAPGTYFENVVLDKDLNLIGTGGQQVTILDGSASGSVVWVGAAEVTLTGLTLTNGTGTSWLCGGCGTPSLYGGGLFAFDSDSYNSLPRVTLTSCTVTGNSADAGGGLSLLGYDPNSELILDDCSVMANSASAGGGIDARAGGVVVEGSAVTGNSGGGALVHGARITDSMINGNTGGPYAGGLSVVGSGGILNPGILTLTSSTVNGNTSAGVYAAHSFLTITDSTVNGNYGVGITGFASTPRLTNSTVNGNHGDGIFNVYGVLTNTTVSNNLGDGIEGSYVTLINSTVSGNTDFGLNLTGTCAVSNSISWGNGLGSLLWGGPGPYGYYILTVNHSLIEGGWAGAGNIDADPLFADPLNGDFHLSSGSPCIDAGDDTSVPTGIWIDPEGKRRFIDDPLTPDTGRPWHLWPVVDMGPFEFGVDPPKKVRQR